MPTQKLVSKMPKKPMLVGKITAKPTTVTKFKDTVKTKYAPDTSKAGVVSQLTKIMVTKSKKK